MSKSNIILVTKPGTFDLMLDHIRQRHMNCDKVLEKVNDLVSKAKMYDKASIRELTGDNVEIRCWTNFKWYDNIAVTNIIDTLDYIDQRSFLYERQINSKNIVSRGECIVSEDLKKRIAKFQIDDE